MRSAADFGSHGVARVLGGEARGSYIHAPGPGHSVSDRSMWVRIDASAPEGFFVGSFAGDPFDQCRDYVRSKIGFAPWKPGFEDSQKRERRVGSRKHAHESADHSRIALTTWSDGQPVKGTIAEDYLVRRIGKPIPWPSDLAFHPRCGRRMDRGMEYHPALIVLLRDIANNQPKAIQRIFLRDDGTDRLRDKMGKATLGSSCGTVAKLSSDENVAHGLALCEGVEKSLALLAIGWAPVWCSIGTSGMANFGPLAGIECLTIFADNDRPGREAARKCGLQWCNAGKQVRIMTPKLSAVDWDDLARRSA